MKAKREIEWKKTALLQFFLQGDWLDSKKLHFCSFYFKLQPLQVAVTSSCIHFMLQFSTQVAVISCCILFTLQFLLQVAAISSCCLCFMLRFLLHMVGFMVESSIFIVIFPVGYPIKTQTAPLQLHRSFSQSGAFSAKHAVRNGHHQLDAVNLIYLTGSGIVVNGNDVRLRIHFL